jgi:hypothetical protein
MLSNDLAVVRASRLDTLTPVTTLPLAIRARDDTVAGYSRRPVAARP